MILPAIPECVTCRRLLCADAAECRGDLAALLRNTQWRTESERRERARSAA